MNHKTQVRYETLVSNHQDAWVILRIGDLLPIIERLMAISRETRDGDLVERAINLLYEAESESYWGGGDI